MNPLRTAAWRCYRRLLGRIRRVTQWEFWPPWAAYIPLIPYLFYLAWKHRSLTLFTATNPGIPTGGFLGESKTRILAALPEAPAFALLSSSLPVASRLDAAKSFLVSRACSYPVVLKPDIGERGRAVRIVRDENELRSYLRTASGDTIIQKYVGGLEFGVFYYRHPGDAEGRIFSITEKCFPYVVGDGASTIGDLILQNDRAVCLEQVYLSRLRRPSTDIPVADEIVPLAEVGSHCRGAVFLNASQIETPALRDTVDRAAKCFEGFYFGRFDVRTPSLADLQAGRFEILELNGVSAEATHVYDPSVTLLEAYRVMFRQWKIAFEIGAANRTKGFQPISLRELVRSIVTRPADSVRCPTANPSKISRSRNISLVMPDVDSGWDRLINEKRESGPSRTMRHLPSAHGLFRS
jgi:hypothetical protein